MEDGESKSPLDRALQRALLTQMQDCYPRQIAALPDLFDDPETDRIKANLLYLEEHGLCASGLMAVQGERFVSDGPRITARGLDFLADDGGLSAILGVVTIKLDSETIRELIAAKIEAEPIPAEEKSRLKRHLAGLSGTVLRETTQFLIRQGLQHLPDGILWLRTLGGT